MARPVAFKDEYVDQARRLALLGLIDDEVAKFLCVTSQTIHNWKKRYPEFAEALNQGKLGPDSEVVMSLYKRATGYSHEAVKIFMTENGPVYAPYTEHYPPDTTACIFWLKNRQPQQWRDVQRQEHTGPDGGPIEVRQVRERNVTIIESISNRDVGSPAKDEVE